jgi:hypothetical protein
VVWGGEVFTESAPEEHFVNHGGGGVIWQPAGGYWVCKDCNWGVGERVWGVGSGVVGVWLEGAGGPVVVVASCAAGGGGRSNRPRSAVRIAKAKGARTRTLMLPLPTQHTTRFQIYFPTSSSVHCRSCFRYYSLPLV